MPLFSFTQEKSNYYLENTELEYSDHKWLATVQTEEVIEDQKKEGHYILITKPKFKVIFDTIEVEIPKEIRDNEEITTIPYSYVKKNGYYQPIFSTKKLKYPRTCTGIIGNNYVLIEGEEKAESYNEIYIPNKGQKKEIIIIEKQIISTPPRIIVNKDINNLNFDIESSEIIFLKGSKWSSLNEILCSKMFDYGKMEILLQKKLKELNYDVKETGFIDDQTKEAFNRFKNDFQLNDKTLNEIGIRILNYNPVLRIKLK